MFDAPCKALPLALTIALAACAHAPSPPAAEVDAAPRATLKAFLDAEHSGDFSEAFALLSGDLRARYTPARLQADFERDRALAEEKLARVRAALESNVAMKIEGHRAELPLAAGRAVKLVEEAEGWKVESLE